MKAVILLASCEFYRTNDCNAAARDTWMRNWGGLIDHKFVLGIGCENLVSDEILVNAPDGYEGSSQKMRGSLMWALEFGYDFVFVGDTDTYIAVPRLLASGFEKHDCTGYLVFNPPFPGGGCGFWLSRRACEAAIVGTIDHWAKEPWISHVLNRAGIAMHHDVRYWCDHGGQGAFPFWDKNIWATDGGLITAHLSRGAALNKTNVYNPVWMYATHRSFLENAK